MLSDVELELQPNAWIATFNIKSMLLIFNLGENNFTHYAKKTTHTTVMMGFHSDQICFNCNSIKLEIDILSRYDSLMSKASESYLYRCELHYVLQLGLKWKMCQAAQK